MIQHVHDDDSSGNTKEEGRGSSLDDGVSDISSNFFADPDIPDIVMYHYSMSSQETSESTILDDGDEEDEDDCLAFVDFESAFTEAIRCCRRDSLNLQKYQGRRLPQQE
jgi:hypothetical protein